MQRKPFEDPCFISHTLEIKIPLKKIDEFN